MEQDECRRRPQTQGEEIANSVSHGVGFVAALASAPVLIATTPRREPL
jgi:hemolysin III